MGGSIARGLAFSGIIPQSDITVCDPTEAVLNSIKSQYPHVNVSTNNADAVAQAGKDFSPSGIATYCYELTKQFNQFYHDYSILNAETEELKKQRLLIARNVAKTIKNAMTLLGIEVPERM